MRGKAYIYGFWIIACSMLLVFLSGCSVLKQAPRDPVVENNAARGTEGALPETFRLHDVPHNPSKQKGPDCGPDSLRMVLKFRGRDVPNDHVIPSLLDKIEARRGRSGGTTFYQMQRIAVAHYGLPAFIIHNCDLDSLKAAIANGWPPIVSYRSSGRNYHAVVAVGYDDKRHTMFIHDPNYLRVTKIRYDDLGGASENSDQRLSCLLVLSEGSTEEELRRGLERYVPKELVEKLKISGFQG